MERSTADTQKTVLSIPLILSSHSQQSILKSQEAQYWISFLGSNVHPWHIWAEKGPSVTAQRIFELVYFPMNLHGISNECNLNQILVYPVNTGLVPIHDKYFVRNLNLILHHFLLSLEVWNMHISINLTSYTSSKLPVMQTFCNIPEHSSILPRQAVRCVTTWMPLYL